MKIIDGKKTSDQIKDELKQEIQLLNQKYEEIPGLAVVIVGENPASKIYVKMKAKACEKWFPCS